MRFLISILVLTILSYCEFQKEVGYVSAEAALDSLVTLLNNPKANFESYVKNNFSPKFLNQFPIQVHTGILARTRDDFAPLKIETINTEGNNETKAVLIGKNGSKVEISLTISKEADHKVDMIMIQPLPPGEEIKDTSFSTVPEALKYLQTLSSKDEFSGAVSAIRDGKSLLNYFSGQADRSRDIPITEKTCFNLASFGKVFTMIAVLQQVEKSLIDINAPIDNYTDIFPAKIAKNVTVLQLLNHTSGWGQYWDNKYFLSNKDHLKSIDDYMKFIKNIPLETPSGQGFHYSNIGFEILGHIVEKVSGTDFYSYVSKNIFDRAGMKNTKYLTKDNLTNNVALGYTSPEKKQNLNWLPYKGTPAGGVYSTVDDLLKFAEAFRQGRLLKSQSQEIMYHTIFNNPKDNSVLNISGGAPGINMVMALDYKNDNALIVLSNFDPPSAEIIFRSILPLVFD